MKIEVIIPQTIVEYLNAKGHNDVKIKMIFKEYVDFQINAISHETLDGFIDWMDNNYEE